MTGKIYLQPIGFLNIFATDGLRNYFDGIGKINTEIYNR